MLDGGFESGGITEIYARWGTGKTQLSHLLAVRALVDDPKTKSIFIDSENTFKADRIKDFAEANNLKVDDVMDRIMIGRALSSDHQLLLVDEIESLIQKDPTYRIIVLDSLTSHFRSDYTGRGELASRQQRLNKHLHQLLKIADIYNLVVVVTNQVQSDPGTFYGNPEKPIGGNIVGHGSTSRIYMRPGKKGTIFAKLVDSPNLPQNECNFLITKNGLEDA
jgi:DNA repair protein RadA